jgi:hypothetical protein
MSGLDFLAARGYIFLLAADRACQTARKENYMNRFERRPIAASEAQVQYLDGDFRVLRPGLYVLCSVTGAAISLDELRYWSVDRQEAYASPAAVMQRLAGRIP